MTLDDQCRELDKYKNIVFTFHCMYKTSIQYISECNQYKFRGELDDRPDIELKMNINELCDECKIGSMEINKIEK